MTDMTSTSAYHCSATNLKGLQVAQVKDFLASFDTVLTDCDGVLWLEQDAIAGSPDVLNTFRALGKAVFYVTNNSSRTREDFVAKAKRLHFIANDNEMISTAYLAADYLKNRNVKRAYVIGSKGITAELERFGIAHFGTGPDVLTKPLPSFVEEFEARTVDRDVDAVVVGFDEHLSYPKLLRAGSYLGNPDCHFVATNTDQRFPTTRGSIVPGTGAIVSAVTTVAMREPFVIGKPNPYIVESLMRDHNLNPKRTLMIGDRCNTDILLGKNCGFQTLLVLTGVTKLSEVDEWKKSGVKEQLDLVPDLYIDKLGDLLTYMK